MTTTFTARKFQRDFILLFLYFTFFCIIGLSLLLKQPFGNPPDEYNRFLIPKYIAENGTLPNGYDESIRIPGYGFSYGFQPILPYILQGYAMRLVSLFSASQTILLYTARMVNFVFGLITALFVWILGRKWFADRRFSWLFSFLVTFLPQSIFVHTYVNTDSCCMMSIAILLYGLTTGLREAFSIKSCILLSIGIILCALSYYNAYGYILSCILLFAAYFLSWKNKHFSFSWKPFLQKGILISVLVLLGISWWFIRSYLLYDGDFLGLRSRDLCGFLYANENLRPGFRVTYASQGISILEMLRTSDFITLSTLSFIGVYGPMTIVTSNIVYRFYKLLFGVGILLCLLPLRPTLPDRTSQGKEDAWYRIFLHCNLFFCMFMPCLLSIIYSYSTDYQPQGRYLLPMLVPFSYYCIRGLEKGAAKIPAKETAKSRALTGICILLCIAIAGSLILTVYGYAFPYYELHPIAD